ncbi:MAG TPA: tetratricopeptide repeat protein, partial [Chitinophagaceae bacterium]|nr:tetratricopeptide repeat protein [Chitinophagaceae bacterium]
MKLALSALLAICLAADIHGQDYIKNGNACYDNNDWLCASENYKSALKGNSYKQQDYGVLLHRIGYAQLKLKNFNESEEFLLKSIAADAGYKYPYWDLGAVYYNLSKYDKAVEYYGKAISFYSDEKSLNSLYYWRGRCNSLNEKYEEAIGDLYKALAYNPNDKDALWEMADAYYNFAHYDSAIVYYSKALPHYQSSKEDQGVLYYWLGQSYFKQEKYVNAVDEYMNAYKFDPENKYLISAIGDAYYNLTDFKDAYEWYSKSIPYYLKDKDSVAASSIYYFMGFSNYRLKEFQRALPDFEKALLYNSKNPSRLAALGDCYRMLKQHDQSINYYTRAIASNNLSNSDKGLYLYWRGKTYQQQNKMAEAQRDWEESFALTTKWVDVSRELADYYWGNKDYEKAEEHYIRVLSSPVYKDSVSLLGMGYYRLG